MGYASRTDVPEIQSRNELEKLLGRICDRFAFFREPGMAILAFENRQAAYRIHMPVPEDDPQENRRRWRCLMLIIKSKVIAIEDGITTFEQEFLAHAVTHDGRTVGQIVIPALQAGGAVALTGNVLALPGGSA